MNKNEIKKTGIFCAVLLYGTILVSTGIKLHTFYTSAVTCRNRIVMLNPVSETQLDWLAERLARLQKTASADSQDQVQTPFPADTARISGATAAIRALLRSHGIQAERFRISGGEPGHKLSPEESAEFVFRCDTLKFFNFLAEVSKQHTAAVTYLSIRAAAGTAQTAPQADITMRIKK
ncbi:hypothetical protein FACS1894124_1810 [Spirochaetia bacterium]|nr:hypothetical protein FACS1894124_1810 [Spirochaetia bacterium]